MGLGEKQRGPPSGSLRQWGSHRWRTGRAPPLPPVWASHHCPAAWTPPCRGSSFCQAQMARRASPMSPSTPPAGPPCPACSGHTASPQLGHSQKPEHFLPRHLCRRSPRPKACWTLLGTEGLTPMPPLGRAPLGGQDFQLCPLHEAGVSFGWKDELTSSRGWENRFKSPHDEGQTLRRSEPRPGGSHEAAVLGDSLPLVSPIASDLMSSPLRKRIRSPDLRAALSAGLPGGKQRGHAGQQGGARSCFTGEKWAGGGGAPNPGQRCPVRPG